MNKLLLKVLLIAACAACACRADCTPQSTSGGLGGACCQGENAGTCQEVNECRGTSYARQPGCVHIPSNSIQCCVVEAEPVVVSDNPVNDGALSESEIEANGVCEPQPNRDSEQFVGGTCCATAEALGEFEGLSEPRGECQPTTTCTARGGRPVPSAGGDGAAGCERLANNIQCCIGELIPEEDVPIPPGRCSVEWLTNAGPFPVVNANQMHKVSSWRDHRRDITKFLLHTEEVYGNERMMRGWRRETKTSLPHFHAGVNDTTGECYLEQYVSLGKAGRALGSGNVDGVIQVEINGFAREPFTDQSVTPYPNLEDCVRELYHGVRAVCPSIPDFVDPRVVFGNSRQGYGYNAPNRLSTSVWRDVGGLVGHQHAPGNTHWDPGAINASELLYANRLYEGDFIAAFRGDAGNADDLEDKNGIDALTIGLIVAGAVCCLGLAGAVLCCGVVLMRSRARSNSHALSTFSESLSRGRAGSMHRSRSQRAFERHSTRNSNQYGGGRTARSFRGRQASQNNLARR